MRKSQFVARGGILTALSLALLLLASVLPTGQIGVCAAAGIVPAVPLAHGRVRLGVLICVATIGLGVFAVPRKGILLAYAAFAVYTLVKYAAERPRRRFLEWSFKMAYCNAVAAAVWTLMRGGLLPAVQLSGMTAVAVLLILNVTFIVYDIAFSRVIALFHRVFPQE